MDVVALHRHGFARRSDLGNGAGRRAGAPSQTIVPEVVLAYDADAAGRAATLRGLELLEEKVYGSRSRRYPKDTILTPLCAMKGSMPFSN